MFMLCLMRNYSSYIVLILFCESCFDTIFYALQNMPRFQCYVVYRGRHSGVYINWSDQKEQLHEYPGAHYKGFTNINDAELRVCKITLQQWVWDMKGANMCRFQNLDYLKCLLIGSRDLYASFCFCFALYALCGRSLLC